MNLKNKTKYTLIIIPMIIIIGILLAITVISYNKTNIKSNSVSKLDLFTKDKSLSLIANKISVAEDGVIFNTPSGEKLIYYSDSSRLNLLLLEKSFYNNTSLFDIEFAVKEYLEISVGEYCSLSIELLYQDQPYISELCSYEE